jgi:outer membrane protein assembly factor BamB
VFINEVNNGLYSLKESDGTVEWSISPRINEDVLPESIAPIYNDGMVYGVGSWESEPIAEGRYIDKSAVYAVNAGTGKVEWVTRLEGVIRPPVIAGDSIYAASSFTNPRVDEQSPGNVKLYRLDAENGSIEWELELTDRTTTTGLAVARDTVYCATFSISFSEDESTESDHRIVAAEPETGSRIVDKSITRLHTLVVGNGHVVTLSGTDSSTTVAMYSGQEANDTVSEPNSGVETESDTENGSDDTTGTADSNGGSQTGTDDSISDDDSDSFVDPATARIASVVSVIVGTVGTIIGYLNYRED